MTPKEALEHIYDLASGFGLEVSDGNTNGWVDEEAMERASDKLETANGVLTMLVELAGDAGEKHTHDWHMLEWQFFSSAQQSKTIFPDRKHPAEFGRTTKFICLTCKEVENV